MTFWQFFVYYVGSRFILFLLDSIFVGEGKP